MDSAIAHVKNSFVRLIWILFSVELRILHRVRINGGFSRETGNGCKGSFLCRERKFPGFHGISAILGSGRGKQINRFI